MLTIESMKTFSQQYFRRRMREAALIWADYHKRGVKTGAVGFVLRLAIANRQLSRPLSERF